MSYATAAALQAAVFARLAGDVPLAALVGGAIHDAAPPGLVTGTYVTLGPGQVRERSDVTGRAAWHDFTVSVVSDDGGFDLAKQVAGAVTDALDGAQLGLSRGWLVGLWFQRATARRVENSDVRRVDLTFRARIDD